MNAEDLIKNNSLSKEGTMILKRNTVASVKVHCGQKVVFAEVAIEAIKKARIEAYNQAIDDVIANVKMEWGGELDEDSILKLKK